MNFISLAAATKAADGATAGAGGQSALVMIVYVVVILGALYFFMIRPNKKKQKQEDAMRNGVQVGDEILTIGGYFGKVVAIKEDSFIIECGPDRSKLRLAKWAIQQNFSTREPEPKEVVKAKKEKKKKDDVESLDR